MSLTLIDHFSLDSACLNFPEGKLYYYKTIAAPADVPTLILIPGWAGAAEMWQRQLNTLSGRFNCLIFDYPGFGRSHFLSANEASCNLNFHAELIKMALDQEGIEDCIAIGHSIGGALALTLAEVDTRIKAVIGADSFTYMNLYPQADMQTAMAIKQGLMDDFAGSLNELMAEYFPPGSDAELRNWVTKTMAMANVPVGAAILEQFMLWNLREKLDAYHGPVFAIAAEDTYVEEDFQPAFGDRIEVTCISKAGHFLMLDQAEAFNHRLLSLLNKLA